MSYSIEIQAYFEGFLKKNQLALDTPYTAWYFGNEEMADELLALVQKGIKQGTTSYFELYEVENEALPQVGEYSVVLDKNEKPGAVIQTKVVEILPYRQISAAHAYLEGEGDKSLTYWQNAHWDFFTKEGKELGKTFQEDSLVVYEIFERVD